MMMMTMMILVFVGVYWGPPIMENYHAGILT